MSQWLDLQAQTTVGSATPVDTSGVTLPSINDGVSKTDATAANTAAPSSSKTMLYLTAAGVILAALALLKKGR